MNDFAAGCFQKTVHDRLTKLRRVKGFGIDLRYIQLIKLSQHSKETGCNLLLIPE